MLGEYKYTSTHTCKVFMYVPIGTQEIPHVIWNNSPILLGPYAGNTLMLNISSFENFIDIAV